MYNYTINIIDNLISAFAWPVGRMFVEKYFDHSAKETVRNIYIYVTINQV